MGSNGADHKGEKNPNYKTGLTARGNEDYRGIYNSWANMKQRCFNKKNPKYLRYGGRGIKIYEPWLDIKVFKEWALNSGWEKGMTIDRINNDGNYCPENCQWLSNSKNSYKRSTTKLTKKDAAIIRKRLKNGESMKEIAKEYGVVHGTIWFIANGRTHKD